MHNSSVGSTRPRPSPWQIRGTPGRTRPTGTATRRRRRGRRRRAHPPATSAVKNRRPSVSYRSTRHRRQPTISEQPLPILADEHLHRRQAGRELDGHHPDTAEIALHRAQCPNSRDPPSTSGPPVSQKRRDPADSQSADLDTLHIHLATEAPQLLQHRPDRLRRLARLQQPDPIALQERPKPPRPSASTRHPQPPCRDGRPRRSKWLVETRNYADKPADATGEKPSEPGTFNQAATRMSA